MVFGAWPMLVVAYLLPGHYPPWPALEQESAAFLAFALLGCGCMAWRFHDALAKEAAALAVLALAVAALSLIGRSSGFVADALISSLYLWMAVLSVQSGRCAAQEPGAKEPLVPLAMAWIIASTVSSVLQGLQWLDVGALLVMATPTPSRPYGNLGQANHVATLHVLGLVGLIYWARIRRPSPWGIVGLGCAMGLGMAMTLSRTGLVQIIVLAGLVWWGRQRGFFRIRRGWIALGLLCGIGLMIAWVELNRLLLLLADASVQERTEAGPRWVIWQSLLAAIRLSPWIGWGWGGISRAQYEVAASDIPAGRLAEYSHNLILDLALWGGVPLAVLCLIAAGGWLVRVIRSTDGVADWFALTSILVVLVHALLEYPHAYAYFLLPVCFLVGHLGRHGSGLQLPSWLSGRMLSVAICASTAAVLAVVGWEFVRVQQADRWVRMRAAGFVVDDESTALPTDSWLDAWAAYQQFRLQSARPGMSGHDLSAMARVAHRFPHPPVLMRYALAAGMNGRPAEAQRALTAICRLHIEARCDEARQGWAVARQRYPELAGIEWPVLRYHPRLL